MTDVRQRCPSHDEVFVHCMEEEKKGENYYTHQHILTQYNEKILLD